MFGGDSSDDDVVYSEEIIDVEAPVEEEIIEEITTPEIEDNGFNLNLIWGVLAAVIGAGVVLLFLRKEWKFIKKR